MSISKKIVGLAMGGLGLAYCASRERLSNSKTCNNAGGRLATKEDLDIVKQQIKSLHDELSILRDKLHKITDNGQIDKSL